jgi:hypothetical protein
MSYLILVAVILSVLFQLNSSTNEMDLNTACSFTEHKTGNWVAINELIQNLIDAQAVYSSQLGD